MQTAQTSCVYLIYEAGNVGPALDFCSALQALRPVRCVLYCPYFLPETETYIQKARSLGLSYVHEATALGGDARVHDQLSAAGFAPRDDAETPPPTPRLAWLVQRVLRLAAPGKADEVGTWIAHYQSRLALARGVLHCVGASRIILPEDNVERDSACWSAAIHDRGGKSQVISYGSVTPQEFALAYWDNPSYSICSLADRLFSFVRPRWKMVHEGRTMQRLPLARAIAMEALGLAPAKPWVVNTGDLDDILVESEFMRQLFHSHGIPRRRIRVAGTAPMDVLASLRAQAHAARGDLIASLGADPAKKVLVCAMPPNQYPSRRSPGMGSYADLVGAWADALAAARDHFNLVVSPHPSSSSQDFECLRAMGAHVQPGSVMNLVPLADLYVASVSSTIKWALACGKPVVNYDCYQYRYSDYAGIAHVHTMQDAAQVSAMLRRFTDAGFLAAQASTAQKKASHFGVLDGQAKKRMASIVLD